MTKICTSCRRERDAVADFHRNGPKRRHTVCKSCRALGYALNRSASFPAAPTLVESR